jgi:hypothetical protein
MLPLSIQWFDWWRRAAAVGWRQLDAVTTVGAAAPFDDPRQMRNRWLADMRQLSADYLKSPAFLALIRFNITLLTHPTMSKAAQFIAWPSR